MPTREEILAAAEQVIGERGVASTTTRQIAEVAGCSEGSIYNHFASKHELVAHAVGARMSDFPQHAALLPERAGIGEVVDNLTELARLAIGFFHRVAPMLGAMIGNDQTMRDHAREVDAAGHGPRWTNRAVVEYLRREQALGRVGPDANLEGAAICFLGACMQQAMLARTWGEEFTELDDDAAAAAIAQALVGGLAPTSTPPRDNDATATSV